MALKQLNLTLTGGVQRLSEPHVAADLRCRLLVISPDDGNGAAFFVGDADLSEANDLWGARLAATSAPFSLGPFEAGGVRLSDVYFDGANGDKVHILVVPW